jgi:hypothetical protein
MPRFGTDLTELAALVAAESSCPPVDTGVVAAQAAQYIADLCGVSPEQVSVELDNSSAGEQ